MGAIVPIFVALPLALGFVFPLLGKLQKEERWAHGLAVAGNLVLLVAALAFLWQPQTVLWVGGWGPDHVIGINLVVDGLTRLFLLTIALVSLLATVFSVSYMTRFTSLHLYYSLFMVMVAGMNGVVLAGDLFNLYVFLEVAALASYALVAFGCESEELEASFKYLVLSALASTFLLFAIGMLYNITGTLNMAQVATVLAVSGKSPLVYLAVAFFTFGFGLKAAMVPFHAWLPDAHPSAPAPISAMLSGVLIKAVGVYGFCRVFFNVIGVTQPIGWVLMALGVVSMLAGVLLAVGQWDFKRLLAYHSISQMGYVVLALGTGAVVLARSGGQETVTAGLAIFGGLFHLFNHAAFKSLLFLCSGAVEYATGTRELKKLGGLVSCMPWTSGSCRVAALSISGVPPLNGFWSKLIIVIALVKAGFPLLAAMTVLVSFLTLVSFVKVQRYVLQGELPPSLARVREVPAAMCLAMVALAVVCATVGIAAGFAGFRAVLLGPARDVMLGGVEYARTILGQGM